MTKDQIEAAARDIAVRVAKNCGSVPNLTFPDIYLGLTELLAAQADAPVAEPVAPAAGEAKATQAHSETLRNAAREILRDLAAAGGVKLSDSQLSTLFGVCKSDTPIGRILSVAAALESADALETDPAVLTHWQIYPFSRALADQAVYLSDETCRGLIQVALTCAHPPAPEDGKDAARDHIRALIGRHADLLEQSEYTYFELAYTRQTGWMAWITDKPLACTVVNTDRKILANGQGDTPDEACRAALSQGGGA